MSGTAVLCTADQTFNIRQVSTSNTVYVTHPCSGSGTDENELPESGLLAIAQCDSSLEVLTAKDVSAIQYLKAALPVYASTGHRDTSNRTSKQPIFDNIPASQGQCEQAWKDLTCFELDDGGCFVPSPALRHATWRAVMTQATADAWDFEQEHQDEVGLLPEEAAEYPRELASAIAQAIRQGSDNDGGYAVDRAKCVHLVGRTLLEALSQVAPDGFIGTADFLRQWRSELPERWFSDASVDTLKGWYHQTSGGKRIAFAQGQNSSGSTKDGVAVEGKSALGVKRKWHDKFRQSKKSR